jgi:hypothetical protein
MTAGQDDGGMVWDIDFVLAEILRSDSFHMDEGPEVDFKTVFFRQVKIGRLIGLRPGLRNEYGFYFQGVVR